MSNQENKPSHHKCRICGKRLSMYNDSGTCFSAHGAQNGFDHLERSKFTSKFNVGVYRAVKDYEGTWMD